MSKLGKINSYHTDTKQNINHSDQNVKITIRNINLYHIVHNIIKIIQIKMSKSPSKYINSYHAHTKHNITYT